MHPSQLARARQFQHFRAYAQPNLNICAAVDVRALLLRCRAEGRSVFAACLHALTGAANDVPQLRQRIRIDPDGADVIVEHPIVHPGFTVLDDDEMFQFCYGTYTDDLSVFCASVQQISRAAKQTNKTPAQLEPQPERDDLLFMTCLPWLNFTSIEHPKRADTSSTVDTVPRIAWGKITDGKMPLAIQVHHALVDGLHVARFFEAAQRRLSR